MEMSDSSKFEIENVVLRSGLDEVGLLAIFKHFSVIDVLMCCNINDNTDPEFVKFMQESVMNTKLFDFTKIKKVQNKWPIHKIFEIFGKSMTMIKVRELFHQCL